MEIRIEKRINSYLQELSSEAITKGNREMRNREFKWAHILHIIRFRYFHIIKEVLRKEDREFFWDSSQSLWSYS